MKEIRFSIWRLMAVMTAAAPVSAFAGYVGPQTSMQMAIGLVLFSPLMSFLLARALLDLPDSACARVALVAAPLSALLCGGLLLAAGQTGLAIYLPVYGVPLWAGQTLLMFNVAPLYHAGLESAGVASSQKPTGAPAGGDAASCSGQAGGTRGSGGG